MAGSNEDSGILDRLAARSNVPELEPLHLAQDWRADEVRYSGDYCATCRWNGRWDDMIRYDASVPRNRNGEITRNHLEQSSSAGNLCCAVLLALVRKLNGTGIWFDNLSGLVVGKGSSHVNQIYLYHDDDNVDAPPGPTVYSNGRHPYTDPRSDAALSWADGHIHDCVHNHDCSGLQSEKHDLPTRLIHIPENAKDCGIRLIRDTSSLPPSTRYAALTHCWGKQQPACLTTVDSIKIHSTKGIPWAVVPLTFKDAIQYTRKLGLEYIWIDSICVIQKDETDWEKESTRMFDYFSNAHVTLGSTFGVDSTRGFFSERHIQASTLYLLDIIFRGAKLGVYAKRHVGGDEVALLDAYDTNPVFAYFDNGPYPLFKRAWTYQERLVSPRLLLFTQYQILYECYAQRHLLGLQGGPMARTLKSAYKLLLTAGREQQQLVHRNETEGGGGRGSWADLVGSFNALQLSFATDQLPAFAAVAQQYLSCQQALCPHLPEEEYLCGLRKSHLHHDLLWKAVGRFGFEELKDDGEAAAYTRGSSYLAPSWSWASVPRLTEYDRLLFAERGHSTITFKGEDVTFTQAGRFGRALGGYIVVQGPVLDCILPLTWHKGDDLDCSFGGDQELLLQDGRKVANFKFQPDFERGYKELEVDGGSSTGEVVVCLLQTWVSGKGLGFLVLLRKSDSQRYHRLGAGFYETPGYKIESQLVLCEHFKHAEQRILEIE